MFGRYCYFSSFNCTTLNDALLFSKAPLRAQNDRQQIRFYLINPVLVPLLKALILTSVVRFMDVRVRHYHAVVLIYEYLI